MSDQPQTIHNTWDDGERFRCTCGWSSVVMWSEASRAMAITQREQHDIINNNKSGDSDGEAAHAVLADFWHPNNPAANADMSMTVTRALRAVRLQERERCAEIARINGAFLVRDKIMGH
jgi:hypothetical protein